MRLLRLTLLSGLVALMGSGLVGCHDSVGTPKTSGANGTSDTRHDATAVLRFEDARPGSGIDFPLAYPTNQKIGIRQTIGFGAALLDADGDGLLDVLLVGPDRVTLYRNLGNWHFAPVLEAGFLQKGYWQGIAVGDFDNDGHPDIFISGYHCSALYRNRSSEKGNIRFEEVTAGSGLANADEWESSAAFADVDGDGRLDLYVTCYVDLRNKSGVCTYPGGIATACSPTVFPPQRGHLYRNVTPPGDRPKFEDVTVPWGLDTAHGNGLGVAFGYIGSLEGAKQGTSPETTTIAPALYLANDQRPCDLFIWQLPQKATRFVNQGTASGTALRIDGAPQSGMGVDFGDYDNDGREDILVTNYQGEPKSLYHNDGEGLFTNTTDKTGMGPATRNGVGWGVKWVDLDNDGWLDLAIANGHPLHRIHELDPDMEARQPFIVLQNRGGQFRMVSEIGKGLPHPISGRALCVGDLDNDGKMDLLISDIEGQPLLLRNVTSTGGNHWLTVKLVGHAVTEGAWVTVQAGEQRWTRRSTTGGSYLSASDPRIHFGLGLVSHLDSVEVHWLNHKTRRLDNLQPDRELTISSD